LIVDPFFPTSLFATRFPGPFRLPKLLYQTGLFHQSGRVQPLTPPILLPRPLWKKRAYSLLLYGTTHSDVKLLPFSRSSLPAFFPGVPPLDFTRSPCCPPMYMRLFRFYKRCKPFDFQLVTAFSHNGFLFPGVNDYFVCCLSEGRLTLLSERFFFERAGSNVPPCGFMSGTTPPPIFSQHEVEFSQSSPPFWHHSSPVSSVSLLKTTNHLNVSRAPFSHLPS